MTEKIRQIMDEIEAKYGQLLREGRLGHDEIACALVRPLLEALGWRLGETLRMGISRERMEGDQKKTVAPDLVLCTPEDKWLVAVEVKPYGKPEGNLDKALEEEKTKKKYAELGVSWLLFTNGVEWRLYDVVETEEGRRPGDMIFKIFLWQPGAVNLVSPEEALSILTPQSIGERRIEEVIRRWKAMHRFVEALKKPDEEWVKFVSAQTGMEPEKASEWLKLAGQGLEDVLKIKSGVKPEDENEFRREVEGVENLKPLEDPRCREHYFLDCLLMWVVLRRLAPEKGEVEYKGTKDHVTFELKIEGRKKVTVMMKCREGCISEPRIETSEEDKAKWPKFAKWLEEHSWLVEGDWGGQFRFPLWEPWMTGIIAEGIWLLARERE